jgi:hypothetical protein
MVGAVKRPAANAARAASAALLALLLLPGLPAGGAGPAVVDRFTDGSSEATFYFRDGQPSNGTTFSISRKAVPGPAGLQVEGLPGGGGEYPSGASLRLGSETVWSFGMAQESAGEMGRQKNFTGGRADIALALRAPGDAAFAQGLVLPSEAVVKEASVEITGAAGPLPPQVSSPPDPPGWLFWNPARGTLLQAAQAGDTVEFKGRDPYTGEVRSSPNVRLALPPGSFVADIQFMPYIDRAALLMPGRGVLVVNLTTGLEQEHFTGTDAASLVAMSFSGGTLAVLGRGWAAVRDLVGGSVERVDSAAFPQVPWLEPVAVDYLQEGQRLIMASRGPFPYKAVSVFRLEDRTVSVFSDLTVTSNLASMAAVPEQDIAILGLGGGGSVNGHSNDRPAVAMSLVDGTVGYVTPLEGMRRLHSLKRQGGAVCAIGYGFEGPDRLALLDAAGWTWRTFSGSGADWTGAHAWAYDPDGARLAVASDGGGIDVYGMDFALMAGRSWHLPGPAGSVPGTVGAVLARGDGIVAATDNGLAGIGPDGRVGWTVDCGRVDALARDPVTGRVVAAGLGGLLCGPGWNLWDRRTLRIADLDLAGESPRDLGRTVPLPEDWFFTFIQGIAPCARNNSVFLSVSSYNASGLYELLSNGTFSRIQTPSDSAGALAISPDGRTLYAACRRAGLLVVDVATGAQELLSPFSGVPLFSPNVASIKVDDSGGVLVAQTPGSQYFMGGVSLLERTGNGTMRSLLDVELGDVYADYAVRDPAGRRIFVVDGDVLSVIDERDGSRSDLRPGAYLRSADWSPEGGFLAGAGSGAAVRLNWSAGPPSDMRLDIGGDGTADWSGKGAQAGASRVDIGPALAGYLASHRAGQRFTEVPMRAGAGSAGVVRLSSLSVLYTLRERVDLQDALAGFLAALPDSSEARVPLELSASGGGLRLTGLNITFELDSAPRVRRIPGMRLDAAASAPTIIDLSKYFTDDRTAPAELAYAVSASGRPGGVGVSLIFGHYLLLDARGSDFRGPLRVSVTAADAQGLPATAEVQVTVFRSGEYVPPPAYYGTLAWVFGAVVLVLGLVALRLYIGAFRRKE